MIAEKRDALLLTLGPSARFVTIVTLTIVTVIFSIDLLLPLGLDNNIYQSMGWELAHNHALPYIGSWDHNFPGIVFVHAISILLFGNHDFSFRFLDVIIHVISAWILLRILSYWLKPLYATFAVILWSLYYVGGLWGLAGQRDEYAVFFLLVGLWVHLRRRHDRVLNGMTGFVLQGIAVALAVLMRPTYGMFAVADILILFRNTKSNFPAIRSQLLWYLAGLALPVAILLAFYLPGQGVVQLYNCIIRYNLEVYANINVPIQWFTLLRPAMYLLTIIGMMHVGREQSPAYPTMQKISGKDRYLLWLYFGSGLLSLLVMHKFFYYHFAAVILFAVVLTSVGIGKLLSLLTAQAALPSLIVLLLVAGYFLFPRHLLAHFVRGLRSGREPLDCTYSEVLSDSLYGYKAQYEVVDFLRSHVTKGECIESISASPSIRWRSELPEATRFTMPTGLTVRSKSGVFTPFQEQWRAEFVRKLIERHPRFILLPSGPHEFDYFIGGPQDLAVRGIPGFDSLLSNAYVLDTTIRGYPIFQLRK